MKTTTAFPAARLLFSLLIFISTSASLRAQTHQARTVPINSNCAGYFEYLPANYNSTSTKYPLIIYLHGAGGQGMGTNSSLANLLKEGVPNIINKNLFPSSFTSNGQMFSFIVISPQFKTKASPSDVHSVIDFVSNQYRVDRSRVYVTGYSVGGDVAWKSPYSVAAAKKMAALAPIAGYNYPYVDTTAKHIAAAELPVWAIHSTSDGPAPSSWTSNMVNKINTFNPAVPPLLTLISNVSHDATHETVYTPSFKRNGLNIYEWFLQYRSNNPPIAHAGNDVIITLPVNQVALNSSGSSDPEGDALQFAWNKLSGPSSYNFNNAALPNPVVSNLVAGTYRFVVRVSDINNLYTNDTVQITVINPNPNQLPVANAGIDAGISLPQNSIVLNGQGSGDGDGVVETYLWTKISGPSVYSLSNSASSTPTVSNLKPGTYVFRLRVTDNEAGVDTDDMQVTVVNPFPNKLPEANAGDDQEITLPDNSVVLNASGSSDEDGSIISHHWTLVSGPPTAIITNPSNESTTASNLIQGTYLFEVEISDDSSGLDKDTVRILVNPAPLITKKYIRVNIYGGSFPAGSGWNNWNVQSSSSLNSVKYSDGSNSAVTATMPGSSSVADNGASYPVTMCPAEVGRTTSYNTGNRTLTISGLDNQKTYDLELYSSRNNTGNSTRFTVGGTNITVLSSDNYNNEALYTNLSPVQGKITVSINRVNTYNYINGFILTEITTTQPSNATPVANAGADQVIQLPSTTVTLNGNNSYDPDGSLISYSWQKMSGGDAVITTPDELNSTVTGLEQGVYSFQLTVTDNNGIMNTDVVQITVEPAPYIAPPVTDSLNCGKEFHIVVLGSSTSFGTGANPIDSSWVNKFALYVKSRNASSTVTNLALGGYTTFQVLRPTGYAPGGGRPSPDPQRNITMALSLNPDLIIINLPSNDAANNYSLQEQKDNYEAALALAAAQQVPVWVSTTQPRNNFSAQQVSDQLAMRNWTHERFLEKSIDFWTSVSNSDGTINSQYNAGDGIHLNNAGHHLLFTRVLAERLLDSLCIIKNLGPVAMAGNPVELTLPANSIQLDGTSSHDPDGNISSYQWAKISGPDQYALSDNSVPEPVLSGLAEGSYAFELMVADNFSVIARDTITVNVLSPGPQAPLAVSSGDTTITLPVNSVQVNADNSFDADGTIMSYLWNIISGPYGSVLTGYQAAAADLENLVEGNYVIELIVTDNDGMIGKDTLTITVEPVPNQMPVARAGDDIELNAPENSTILDGSLSSDADGELSYLWSKVSGPDQFLIADASLTSTAVGSLTYGIYIFELLVTDNDGAIAKDSVTVTVIPPPNILPEANAGDDSYTVLPVNTYQLDGSGSFDTDGTIAYLWTKFSGPSSYIISNNTAIKPDISNLTHGVYGFELIVTDDRSGTDKDTVYITVFKALNNPPVARAGNDQSITLPTTSTTLNGSTSTDADGMITSYLWQQVSGPSASNLSTAANSNTNVSSLTEGEYLFELTVTDDSSTVSKDTVQITVNPAPLVTEKFIKVNIYGGSSPAGAGWNNWNVQSNLSLNSTAYSDGTASPLTAVLNTSNAVADNGSSYQVTMCPTEVGRTASYSTVIRSLTLSGLDNQKQYNLELYSSRNSAGNSTRFTVQGVNVTVLSSFNSGNPAVFSNISPQQGRIIVAINRVNTYNYINGFILTELNSTATRAFNPVLPNSPASDTMSRDELPGITGIYPNPFANQLQLYITNEFTGKVKVDLFDQSGKIFQHAELIKTSATLLKNWQTPGLPKGIYFIRLEMEGWRNIIKVVKQ